MTTILDTIYRYNRYPELSDWFKQRLDDLIGFGAYNNDTASANSAKLPRELFVSCTIKTIYTMNNFKIIYII